MKGITTVLLLASIAAGDAGYLGTPAQGPSPAWPGGETPVRMASEDVFISLEDCSTAVVSGAFLFESGEECRVLLCYPLEIHTVFSQLYDSVVYDLDDDLVVEAPEPGMRVLVDGREVETFLLVQCDSWEGDEEIERALREAYGWPDPDAPSGEGFLVTRPPASDSAASEAVIMRAQALLVCWEMDVEPGAPALVEIEDRARLTSDYGGRLHRLTYPLVTGASWNGPIGTGRVSIVARPGFDWDSALWWTGVLMPVPREEAGFVPSPVPGLGGSALLAPFMGADQGRAIVWEFEDFEPVAGRRDSYTYFPDIGDVGGMVESEAIEGIPVDSPWESSFVYLYLGPVVPGGFMCIRSGGVVLREFPSGAACAEVPPGWRLSLMESTGDWMRVQYEPWDGDPVEGWLQVHPLRSDGLVEATVIPLPETAWEP